MKTENTIDFAIISGNRSADHVVTNMRPLSDDGREFVECYGHKNSIAGAERVDREDDGSITLHNPDPARLMYELFDHSLTVALSF